MKTHSPMNSTVNSLGFLSVANKKLSTRNTQGSLDRIGVDIQNLTDFKTGTVQDAISHLQSDTHTVFAKRNTV